MTTTNFINDIDKGKVAEAIFKNNLLAFIGIPFADVSENKEYQNSKIDVIGHGFTVDVKTYTMKGFCIIEEYTNYAKEYGNISFGWFDKSKASVIVYVCIESGEMVILRFDARFKDWYMNNKTNYELKLNKVSEHNGKKWQSAYRAIPIKDMVSFVSYYKLYSQNGEYVIYPESSIPLP